jgi:glycosyltransferase involved in cell wall biosynthesis
VPEGVPVFGLFGRIVPWKGVREYVDAAAIVLEALPEARALVVGSRSDGEAGYADAVRRRAQELGLADRVLFLGFRPDVAELMRLCDVVVHASLIPEPFGLVVVEALATGTPVVAADRGGPTDIIEPGESGFLVDPHDAAAMAGAVLRLLRDSAEARRMGEAGAVRIAERFSARRSADGVFRLYARLLGVSAEGLRRGVGS